MRSRPWVFLFVSALGVLSPKLAEAHEIKCLLEAKDEDELADCIGLFPQPVTRVVAIEALGAGEHVRVASLWLEGGARPWSQDASHAMRHFWINAALPVSTANGSVAAPGNGRVGVSYDDDTVGGSCALTLPTARGPRDEQTAAAAAWGYERNPSFTNGGVGISGGVDLDTPPATGQYPDHGELRAGVSLHAQTVVGSDASAFEVLPEARIAWTPYRLAPYRPETFRGVTVLVRAWSDVRFDASTHAALVGEARLVLNVSHLKPTVGLLVPIAALGARVVAMHAGLEAYF